MRAYRAYRGGYRQRGAGLGNIIGALFRAARPLIRSGIRAILPVAAGYGSRVLGDVAEGHSFVQSAKRHAPQAGMDTIREVARNITGQRERRRGGTKRRNQRGQGLARKEKSGTVKRHIKRCSRRGRQTRKRQTRRQQFTSTINRRKIKDVFDA